MTLAAASAVAGVLAVAAGILGWLTGAGVGAAFLVGTAVFAGAGIEGGSMLGLFVVSGSVLSRSAHPVGTGPTVSRRGRRDAVQVAANGLWAAAGALAVPHIPLVGWPALTGALAAGQADTWATEIGTRAGTLPRLITSGEAVAHGTDGGVTPLGTGVGIAGACLMAVLAMAMGLPRQVAVGGLVGGIAGMVVDSLLGATLQARPVAPEGNAATEVPPPPAHARRAGWKWCTNDVVNVACTGTGAVVAVGVALWLPSG